MALPKNFIYTFSDGVLETQMAEPLIMINGTFSTEWKAVTAEGSRRTLVGFRDVVEAFDGAVSWNTTENKALFQLDASIIEITLDAKGQTKKCLVNGMDRAAKTTMNMDDDGNMICMSVDGHICVNLKFIAKYLQLDTGYLPGNQRGLGGIAHNSVIWIDKADEALLKQLCGLR